jgi:hypothetical protein
LLGRYLLDIPLTRRVSGGAIVGVLGVALIFSPHLKGTPSVAAASAGGRRNTDAPPEHAVT